jgi:hypothetical protein
MSANRDIQFSDIISRLYSDEGIENPIDLNPSLTADITF